MPRRYITIFIVAIVSTIIVYSAFNTHYRSQLQSLDGGKGATSPDGIDPHAWKSGRENGVFLEPKVDAKSPYPVGQTKPAGSNYTRTLVVPKLRGESIEWIDLSLSDMLRSGLLDTAVYVMDDLTAPLHPVKNKGHEVMAYLSYIVDFYDNLPDIAIFMHAHSRAWHNNKLLNEDSALMVRHLSPERVTRDGYMNLRCHWEPGCPDWLHPPADALDEHKQEAHLVAGAWQQLFPLEDVPTILGQPCCAQFAVSRDRIHAISKSRFVWLRDWILRTDLDDFISGRIFEYVWQYIFTSSPVHCPSMSACYCDGYGICFGGPEDFDYYFELMHNRDKLKASMKLPKPKVDMIADAQRKAKDGQDVGEDSLNFEESSYDQLKAKILLLEKDMAERLNEAFERGQDPRSRAMEAGREWKEGDGF